MEILVDPGDIWRNVVDKLGISREPLDPSASQVHSVASSEHRSSTGHPSGCPSWAARSDPRTARGVIGTVGGRRCGPVTDRSALAVCRSEAGARVARHDSARPLRPAWCVAPRSSGGFGRSVTRGRTVFLRVSSGRLTPVGAVVAERRAGNSRVLGRRPSRSDLTRDRRHHILGGDLEHLSCRIGSQGVGVAKRTCWTRPVRQPGARCAAGCLHGLRSRRRSQGARRPKVRLGPLVVMMP